jgi:hypothetical protein
MRTTKLLPLVALLGGCAALRGTERSTVSTSQVFSSAYWFRGVPRSQQPVTQGDLLVDTPLATGGTLSFVTWYNLQLTNRTGDAAFPDGNGGQNTEIDLVLDYTQSFGRVSLSAGGVAYHFPNQIAPSTKEAYLSGELEVLGLSHAVSAHYDLDRLDDLYFSYQTSKGFALDERWSAALGLLLGYMGDGQGEGYFGTRRSGFSDLLLTGSLTYAFDENTSVFLKLAGVTVPDGDLSAALEQEGLDDTGMWLTLGAAWGL